MIGFELQRLGLMMEPEPGNLLEAEGVLNPAAVRGPDGELYLFPRLVARGNYSRIGIARVRFNGHGDPAGVERIGIALEPEADYERNLNGGGCEDPRITFFEPFQQYMMTYTAHTAQGPRIALAISKDLLNWKRIGLAVFAPHEGIKFHGVDNKDASIFPVAINDPSGRPSLAILHRPLFSGSRPDETARYPARRSAGLNRAGIWISYCPLSQEVGRGAYRLGPFTSHQRIANPASAWERLKIGVGTPPIGTRHGWLIIYHGVSAVAKSNNTGAHLCYSAGVMVLSKTHPDQITYRSPQPVLTPLLPEELEGIIPNVVFPTGIDQRLDLGQPDRFDVYYGMADNRIGVARINLPDCLIEGASTNHPQKIF